MAGRNLPPSPKGDPRKTRAVRVPRAVPIPRVKIWERTTTKRTIMTLTLTLMNAATKCQSRAALT